MSAEPKVGRASLFFTIIASLEGYAVRQMGPRSPFYQCVYCTKTQTSPLMFPHDVECIITRGKFAAETEGQIEAALERVVDKFGEEFLKDQHIAWFGKPNNLAQVIEVVLARGRGDLVPP